MKRVPLSSPAKRILRPGQTLPVDYLPVWKIIPFARLFFGHMLFNYRGNRI